MGKNQPSYNQLNNQRINVQVFLLANLPLVHEGSSEQPCENSQEWKSNLSDFDRLMFVADLLWFFTHKGLQIKQEKKIQSQALFNPDEHKSSSGDTTCLTLKAENLQH